MEETEGRTSEYEERKVLRPLYNKNIISSVYLSYFSSLDEGEGEIR